jgi:hypothetical protein
LSGECDDGQPDQSRKANGDDDSHAPRNRSVIPSAMAATVVMNMRRSRNQQLKKT